MQNFLFIVFMYQHIIEYHYTDTDTLQMGLHLFSLILLHAYERSPVIDLVNCCCLKHSLRFYTINSECFPGLTIVFFLLQKSCFAGRFVSTYNVSLWASTASYIFCMNSKCKFIHYNVSCLG